MSALLAHQPLSEGWEAGGGTPQKVGHLAWVRDWSSYEQRPTLGLIAWMQMATRQRVVVILLEDWRNGSRGCETCREFDSISTFRALYNYPCRQFRTNPYILTSFGRLAPRRVAEMAGMGAYNLVTPPLSYKRCGVAPSSLYPNHPAPTPLHRVKRKLRRRHQLKSIVLSTWQPWTKLPLSKSRVSAAEISYLSSSRC